jgi:hypothetical protein
MLEDVKFPTAAHVGDVAPAADIFQFAGKLTVGPVTVSLKFCVTGVVDAMFICPTTICPANSIAINKKFKKVFDESNFVSIIF